MGSLNDFPPELVVGWALWLVGGLALMVWFRRRSEFHSSRATPTPVRSLASPPPTPSARQSGVRPAAGRTAPTPEPPLPVAPSTDDAFAELAALLEPTDNSQDTR